MSSEEAVIALLTVAARAHCVPVLARPGEVRVLEADTECDAGDTPAGLARIRPSEPQIPTASGRSTATPGPGWGGSARFASTMDPARSVTAPCWLSPACLPGIASLPRTRYAHASGGVKFSTTAPPGPASSTSVRALVPACGRLAVGPTLADNLEVTGPLTVTCTRQRPPPIRTSRPASSTCGQTGALWVSRMAWCVRGTATAAASRGR